MTANIIQIGNSRGVILPTEILRQMRLTLKSAVNIDVTNEYIVIKAAPRRGWEESAKEMAKAGDDKLLMPVVFGEENLEWWEWDEGK